MKKFKELIHGGQFGIKDGCENAMAEYLSTPLTDVDEINARLDTIEELVKDPALFETIKRILETLQFDPVNRVKSRFDEFKSDFYRDRYHQTKD